MRDLDFKIFDMHTFTNKSFPVNTNAIDNATLVLEKAFLNFITTLGIIFHKHIL